MKNLTALFKKQDGSSLIEVAIITPVLLFLMVGAVDFGRGYYYANEVSAAAETGALYGSLNNTDTAGMIAAAKLDAKDVSGINVTAITGCECSDGTHSVTNCGTAPTCGVNVVNFVEVDTSATYTPILKYPGIGSSFALTGKGRLRASH
jgi:Flp pilus assembly protein TadG